MTLLHRIALIAVAVLALTAGTSSAATPPRTVHLYGDSIMKGWGFGHYDNQSFLGRVDLIATVLARANGSTLRFNRTTVQAPSRICMAVRSGEIKATDTIVFEDAGPRFESANAEQAWLEHVVKCSTRYRGRTAGRMIASPARLVLSTMFDYNPDPVTVPNSTYDTPLDDGRTVNEIVRGVARRSGARLLDWNASMDAARSILEPQGVRVMHPDGIHPTVWGNIILAASILRREGVRLDNVEPILDELMLRDMGRFAPAFTREQAAEWVTVLAG